MHKTKQEEAVTSLHDLSAVDLIAGYKTKQFSPSEVLEDVITHVARWEPHIKALYAYDPSGIGWPLVAMFSLIVTGTPSSTPDGSPAFHRSVEALATLRAPSGSKA